jgi:hypothetical protein
MTRTNYTKGGAKRIVGRYDRTKKPKFCEECKRCNCEHCKDENGKWIYE